MLFVFRSLDKSLVSSTLQQPTTLYVCIWQLLVLVKTQTRQHEQKHLLKNINLHRMPEAKNPRA